MNYQLEVVPTNDTNHPFLRRFPRLTNGLRSPADSAQVLLRPHPSSREAALAERRVSSPAAARGLQTETRFPLVINAGHLIDRMRSPVGRGATCHVASWGCSQTSAWDHSGLSFSIGYKTRAACAPVSNRPIILGLRGLMKAYDSQR